MKNLNIKNTFLKYTVLIAILFVVNFSNSYSQLVVIVNNSNNMSNISASEFKSYFLGEKTKMPSGSNVILTFSKEENKTRELFCNLMGKKFSELMNVWLKKSLNDGWKSPSQFSNDGDVISLVAKTPGAIGFISASSVNSSVKVVSIDGKKQVD